MTNFESIIKEIETRMQSVTSERDNLDEFISELEQLKENCSEAYDCLQRARDALSELV